MGDFQKVFTDFGPTETFELIPAVRSVPNGCVDEKGCDWEKITLCAFEHTNSAQKMNFLDCMDKSEGSPTSAAKACADIGKLDFSTISSCSGGPQGKALLQAASNAFNKRLPGRTGIPHTFVNAQDVPPDYLALKKALCEAGSQATACALI